MNTTVSELKELYESLGGTPSDVADITTIPDMIAALAEVAGTTIELPAVGSTDNGDVLTVVSGKWAKADPPKELPTSATSGQVLTYNGNTWGAANVPTELPASATSGQVLTYIAGAWGAANVPAELPTVTADDNGDVLTVVEGAWSKAALPKEMVYVDIIAPSDFYTPTNAISGNVTVENGAEIVEAVANGEIVAVRLYSPRQGYANVRVGNGILTCSPGGTSVEYKIFNVESAGIGFYAGTFGKVGAGTLEKYTLSKVS